MDIVGLSYPPNLVPNPVNKPNQTVDKPKSTGKLLRWLLVMVTFLILLTVLGFGYKYRRNIVPKLKYLTPFRVATRLGLKPLPANYSECLEASGSFTEGKRCIFTVAGNEKSISSCLKYGGCNPSLSGGTHSCQIAYFDLSLITYPLNYSECYRLGDQMDTDKCSVFYNTSCSPLNERKVIMANCPYGLNKNGETCETLFYSDLGKESACLNSGGQWNSMERRNDRDEVVYPAGCWCDMGCTIDDFADFDFNKISPVIGLPKVEYKGETHFVISSDLSRCSYKVNDADMCSDCRIDTDCGYVEEENKGDYLVSYYPSCVEGSCRFRREIKLPKSALAKYIY